MHTETVDVLIPVYQPDERLEKIIERLHRQSRKIRSIKIINTGRAYFDAVFPNDALTRNYPDVEVRHITPEEYDHGGTRRALAAWSDADFIVFMTDDAVPADTHLIERLLEPLIQKVAAVSFARQLPRRDLKVAERYVRCFNYPAASRIKTAADLPAMGIKAFFCSNVCAAYNRAVYEELGGFEERIIFNEDMVYARNVMNAGYAIAYVSTAKVIHSHNYTALQQLRRNFDLGVSQAMYPEVFGDVSSEGEGLKMLKSTVRYLLRRKAFSEVLRLFVASAAKYAGYFLGKRYRYLPMPVIRKLTMNPRFWD